MTDVHCQRCGQKVGWRKEDAYGVTVKCGFCGAKVPISLDRQQSVAAK